MKVRNSNGKASMLGAHVSEHARFCGFDVSGRAHSERCAPSPASSGAKLSFGHSFVIRLWAFVILATLLLLVPRLTHAHGELLIRIGAASRELATNPAPELYLKRGELYREDQNWAAAETDYRKAAEAGMDRDAVDFCRAQLFADRNDLGPARELLSQMIERHPRKGKALVARARIFVRLHEAKLAIADFGKASDCGAEMDSAAWLEWGQMLTGEKRVDEALNVLDRGIQQTGAISTLQVYAVDLELARDNKKAALARLQTIIDAADRKERWFARRGQIQLAAGDQLAARESYENAIASIKRLPKILQATPAMLNLKSEIDAVLAGMGKSPAVSKVGVQ